MYAIRSYYGQRLCRKVADISVKTGEYVCHEGDNRSLFGILEGRFEAVRLIDGAERVLGQRHPGQVFGEMSIVFGMPQPAGLRAAEPSRCFKIVITSYSIHYTKLYEDAGCQ